MFEELSGRLSGTLKRLESPGPVSRSDFLRAVEEIRIACVAAGTSEEVVTELVLGLVEGARAAALLECPAGAAAFRALLRWLLTRLMQPGPVAESLPEREDGPLVVLLTGSPGTGMTATAAMLARHLAARGRRTLLAATGTPEDSSAEAPDVVLHVGLPSDERHVRELREAIERIRPHEILYVADAREGPEAVREAEAADREIPLTGVILTNVDRDARGGAVLSIGRALGRAVRFVGIGGELEPFRPERIAARMLGEPDEPAPAERLFSGTFTMDDYLGIFDQMEKLGPLERILEMMPGGGSLAGGRTAADIEQEVARSRAIVAAMTPEERAEPESIDTAGRLRIARESGASPTEVDDLLKEFHRTRRLFRQLGGGALRTGPGPPARGWPLICPDCRRRMVLAEDPRTVGEAAGRLLVLVTYRCARGSCPAPVERWEIPERELSPEERRRWQRWK